MLEFKTLGTIDLRADDGTLLEEPLRHSKRIALLAYLTVAHPIRLHRRATLINLLWPELDEGHGRGMLRHELYELRRALGPDVFATDGGEAVGVDGERVWCDARAFEEAVADERLSEALDLVRGELLPGLNVDGGTFDRWLDTARDGLMRRACAAAATLSAEAEESGDLPAAVRWARRWTELAWHDEIGWCRLLMLLDRAGDRAGALAAYEDLSARLSEELGVEPAPETRVLADGIRARNTWGEGDGDLRRRPLESGSPAPVRIAVRPARNETGDERRDPLALRLTELLINGVAELAYVEVTDGGDVTGATAVVSATLQASAGRLEACARLSESGDPGLILAAPPPVALDLAGDDESLGELVARVLAAIAVRYDPRVPMAFVHGTPVRTPSWEAWLEFTQGSEAFGAFRFAEAARRLRRANEIDADFLKAGVFAAIAMAYTGDLAGAEALARRALAAGAETASDYERHFADWFLADLTGRRAEAYRASQETVRLTGHPVIRFLAGREALRLNRPAEALQLLEGAQTDYGWWRNWTEVYEVVGGACHMLGEHQSELEAILTGRQRHPESLARIRAEVRARAALGQCDETLDAVHEALTLSPDIVTPGEVASAAAQELEAHGYGEEGAAARQAGLAWLHRRGQPTAADRALETRMLLESGDATRAAECLETVVESGGLEPLGLAGLVAATRADTSGADEVIARLNSLQNPYLSGRHLLLEAEIQAALNRADAAVEALRRARAHGLPTIVELHAMPTLRSLASHPGFASLLRPRG